MRPIALAAAVALAALALLACGGSDPARTGESAPAATATQAATEPAAVAVAPKVYFIHTEW